MFIKENGKGFSTYIKLNYKYTLRRRIEFLQKGIFAKIPFNLQKHYILVNLVMFLIESIILFTTTYAATQYLSQYIYSITYYYFLILAIVVVIQPLYSRLVNMLTPIDRKILYRSPLRSRDIYNLLWLNDFVKGAQSLLLYLVIGQGIAWNFDNVFIFSLHQVILFVICVISSYIFQYIYISLKVFSIKKGYGIRALILNLITGTSLFLGSIIFFKILFGIIGKALLEIINSVRNSNTAYEWGNLIQLAEESLRDIHNFIAGFLDRWAINAIFMRSLNGTLYDTDLIILGSMVMLCIVLLPYSYMKAGHWYRNENMLNEQSTNGWLAITGRILNSTSRDMLTRLQITKLFRDKEQLSLNYTFFFISFSLWIFAGAAVALSEVSSSSLVNLLGVTFITHAICRDSFSSGTDMFPGHLNFDSDGRSVALFRITGVSLYQLYKSKINTMRILGYQEVLICVVIILSVFDLNIEVLLISFQIILLNYLLVPHLSLLSSYLSPHFKQQHYNEASNFDDQEFLDENIFIKVKDGITLLLLFPFLIAYMMNIDIQKYYLYYSIWVFLMMSVIYVSIRIIIFKSRNKIDRRDVLI